MEPLILIIPYKLYKQNNYHFEYASAIEAQTLSLPGRPCSNCGFRAFTGMPVTPHAGTCADKIITIRCVIFIT